MSILLSDDLPVITSADVLNEYPAEVQASDTAPVRDTIVAAQTAMFCEYQRRAQYAADQGNILYATDIYLDGLGEDRGYQRQPGELDADYRTRILSVPNLVTPNDILKVVRLILSPYTSVLPCYMERITDCMFLRNDSVAGWHAFLDAPPDYTDRFYAQLPQRNPGHAWTFSDTIPRYFVLRVPSLSGTDSEHAYLTMAFLGDGSNTGSSESSGSGATFLFEDRLTSIQVYNLIASTIERIKGQGIRWKLYVDPTLT